MNSSLLGRTAVASFVGLLISGSVPAQDQPAAVQRSASAAQPAPGDQQSKAKPDGSDAGKPSENGKPKGKEGESKPDDPPKPKVIRRGETVQGEADPEELKATVGEDGKVAFQFRNQPWVDLVQWLAEISDQPLDWQELPADRVHLRSPGRYTVEQTRDLFNRYLLARGYTLLELDGGLTVAKTEQINPAIVPRVDVEQLSELPAHSYVRTLLDVGWLSAEKLTEELKPMISSNGRLTALATTNRIEAMDAVVNLQQVAELLNQERDSTSREALAPEFKLRYLPAEEAKRLLEEFLGVEKKDATPMTPQQMQMMAQMRNQNQQNAAPAKKEVEISIVANPRQNSVLIRAPVDRVAIATEFLKRVDVPGESMVSLADVQSRVQVFRMETLDPEKLIEIVSEMNILEPTTRVRVDKDNNALIVSGSAADRYIISSLIERLDGSGRKFEVLQLRRLDAGEVAESIAFLMGQKDEDDDSNSRRRSYYYYGYGYGNDDQKSESDEFRVAANARYRQVLLWANEHEMEEVRSLLIKLGELPPPGGSRQTIRMIDASATPETYEYLQRLKQQWNRLAPNPLELPDAERFQDPNANESDDAEDESSSETDDDAPESQQRTLPSDEPVEDTVTAAEPSLAESYLLTKTDSGTSQVPAEQAAGASAGEGRTTAGEAALSEEPTIRSSRDFDRAFRRPAEPPRSATSAAPVRIELDSNGNLVLVSPDTDALDRLEELMLQVAPPKRPYHVFHIEHASAFWMKLNLEDYFEEEDENGESDADAFYRWYWGAGDSETDSGPSGLAKGNRLKFVEDPDTNTLVVSGATTQQLKTIQELIDLWDVPEQVNKRKTRFTRLVHLQYGQSEPIAETVKEAYRDLLSSNDKSFQGAGGQGGQRGGGGASNQVSKSREGNGSGLADSESGRDGGSTDFSFKGKLSLGIDKVGNTLLVSAEGEPLLELVCDMIEQLDQAARPQGGIEVMQFSGDIGSQSLQKALRALGAAPIEDGTPSSSVGVDRGPRRTGGEDRRRFGEVGGAAAAEGGVSE